MYLNKILALAAFTLLLWGSADQQSFGETTNRPNFLFIISEDNGPELSCYGDPYARTPNLDRLAAEGVRFDRAYVAQAGCSQSRAAYLTGLYPHQNGQIGLATWNFRMYRDDTPNIARNLKAAGYRTGIIGKLHVNPAEAFPFDVKEIPTANFQRKNLGDYARFAGEFMRSSEKPFFLSVNYPDAHSPWLKQVDGLPKEPLEADDITSLEYMGVDTPELRAQMANHYNCMARLDALVGDLLATLEISGKADNTFVLYFGDHGADFLRGKRTSYEGGVRVPFIIRWPGHVRPGQVSEKLVSTVDLMPTLLDLAGAEPVTGLPGRSLRTLLHDKSSPWRDYLFTEYHTHAATNNYYPQRTVCSARYKLIENLLPNEVNPGYDFAVNKKGGDAHVADAIRNASPQVREAYKRMEMPSRFELYDLEGDPFEFRDLAGDPDYAQTLQELQQQLQQWRETTRDPLLNPDNLHRLKAEMGTVTSKKEARKREWEYLEYFFDASPAKTGQP